MPVRYSEERVHAEEQTQRPLRKFLAQLGQRIDGVGSACAAHLAIIDHEGRLVRHRRAHHGHAQLRIGERAFAMRRIACRQEPDFGSFSDCQSSKAVRRCP